MNAEIKAYNLRRLFSVIRTVALYLIFFAAVSLRDYILSFTPIFDLSASGLYNDKTHAFAVVFPLILAYFSFSRTFILYNTPTRNEYLANTKRLSAFKDIIALLTSKAFWLDIMCLTVMAAVSPISSGFLSLQFLLFGSQPITELQYRLQLLGILVPMFVLLNTAAHLSVHRFWNKHRVKFSKFIVKKREDVSGLITDLIVQMIVFSFIFYMFPILVTLLLICWQALSFIVLPIIMFIVPLSFLYYAHLYIRAIKKRKKFISELKKVCGTRGVLLSEIRNPIKSIFKLQAGFDFSITADGITYDCKLLSGIRPGSPMVFTPTNGLLVVPFKFLRFEWFRLFFKFEYQFDSVNKKLVVVSPMPCALYEKDYHPRAEMDPGGTVYGYKILNSSCLIGGIERGTLARI